MTTYSSSTISAMRHCPAALDYQEAGAPRDDASVMHAGVSAHACLEAIGVATTEAGGYLAPPEIEAAVRGPVERLIAEGYTFAGDARPPLPPEPVFEGRDLALDYQAGCPIPPGGRYEIGWAADAQWKPVAYDSPKARWRAVIDRVDSAWVGDEEGGAAGVEVTDYKTSWAAGVADLSTVQRRGQAVLAEIHSPAAGGIRLTVVGVRRRQTYSTGDRGAPGDIYPGDPEGRATLDRWRSDLEALMRIADRDRGKRPHVPGAGCIGCPYYTHCDHGREHWRHWHPENAPAVLAGAYAAAHAAAKHDGPLRSHLNPLLDQGPVEMPGGRIEWVTKEELVPAKDHARAVARQWIGNRRVTEDLVAGLVNALKVTGAQLERVAHAAHEDPAAAGEWYRSVTRVQRSRKLEITKEGVGNG